MRTKVSGRTGPETRSVITSYFCRTNHCILILHFMEHTNLHHCQTKRHNISSASISICICTGRRLCNFSLIPLLVLPPVLHGLGSMYHISDSDLVIIWPSGIHTTAYKEGRTRPGRKESRFFFFFSFFFV